MKKYLFGFLLPLVFMACKENGEVEPLKLISKNSWELERFTNPKGSPIATASLNTQAKLLFGMQFEFKENGEVRGIDRQTKVIIQKGVWKFMPDDKTIQVEMPGFSQEFEVIKLNTGVLILGAPTGNFLSGVGQEVNLEFKSVKQ